MERVSFKKVFVCFCMLIFTAIAYGENYVFKSYHIYTSEEDKYLKDNIQDAESKVSIDEINQTIKLSLYNRESGKWTTFTVKIDYKMDLGFKTKVGTLYLCKNNGNQTCGVCIVNTNEGKFIDLHNFYSGEQTLSCWVNSEE